MYAGGSFCIAAAVFFAGPSRFFSGLCIHFQWILFVCEDLEMLARCSVTKLHTNSILILNPHQKKRKLVVALAFLLGVGAASPRSFAWCCFLPPPFGCAPWSSCSVFLFLFLLCVVSFPFFVAGAAFSSLSFCVVLLFSASSAWCCRSPFKLF